MNKAETLKQVSRALLEYGTLIELAGGSKDKCVELAKLNLDLSAFIKELENEDE